MEATYPYARNAREGEPGPSLSFVVVGGVFRQGGSNENGAELDNEVKSGLVLSSFRLTM